MIIILQIKSIQLGQFIIILKSIKFYSWFIILQIKSIQLGQFKITVKSIKFYSWFIILQIKPIQSVFPIQSHSSSWIQVLERFMLLMIL